MIGYRFEDSKVEPSRTVDPSVELGFLYIVL
jgi:hypothetical protein